MKRETNLKENLKDTSIVRWYVMRDLSRARVRVPMFQMLEEMGVEVFTPHQWVMKEKNGRVQRVREAVIKSLLFVNGSVDTLRPIVEKHPSLQFRYQRGKSINEPMSVPDAEMMRFKTAIEASLSEPLYIPLEEITPDKLGKDVEIVGGSLDGYTGKLLKMRGTTKKRLVVELKNYIAAAVEVSPEYVKVL